MDMLLKFGIGADSSTFELPHYPTPVSKRGFSKRGISKWGFSKRGFAENLGQWARYTQICLFRSTNFELGNPKEAIWNGASTVHSNFRQKISINKKI